MSFIRAEALSHIYCQGTPFEAKALDNVNMEIGEGELLAVIGHTGSGKSTFIQHLNGLLLPTSGRLFVDGEDIASSKAAQRRARAKVGLVFQYPEYQLFEETVHDDIAFGPKNMGLTGEELEQNIREAARFAGVPEDVFGESPLELSGGQKRRVAIAGVIAMRPRVLVLDEPAAGLDPVSKDDLMKKLEAYRAETGSTVIIVSHSMDDVARMAERIVVFDRGTVALDGTPQEIFSRGRELEDMHLSVPEAARIAEALRRRGVSLPSAVYTTEDLRDLLVRTKGDRPC